MKKIYVLPSCSIVDITPTTLMNNTSLNPNETGNQTVTPDGSEPAPNEFTSRRRSVWEEEEEDEY